jgi:alpha-mannosidase
MSDIGNISVSVVPSFHYDVAYLKSYQEYLGTCFAILDKVLAICEANPEYRYTIEQVILLREYWNRFPKQRSKLEACVRRGQIEIAPGMFVMPDMNHADGESLFQQAKIGKRWLARTFGVDSSVCWIADCWGHHAQLPQILSQSGYEYYVFWRCMRPDVLINNFRWSGLDGTEIRTHWLSRGYSGLSFPDDSVVANELDLDFVESNCDSMTAAVREIGEYGDESNVLICNGGDFRFPQETAISMLREYNRRTPGINATLSTPLEYLDEQNWEEAPVRGGEFNSAFQGTFTTNVWIKQGVRALVARLRALEALSVSRGYPAEHDELWEPVLKQQFHDIICGSICDDAVNDCRAEIANADERITNAFARFDDATGQLCVFNPLCVTRVETIEVDGIRRRISLEPYATVAVSTAVVDTAVVDTAVVDTARRTGFSECRPELPYTFKGDFYTASIDVHGYITSLVETTTDRELVDPMVAPFGVVSMQMDYGDSWLNFEGPISGGSLESSLTQNVHDPLYRNLEGALSNRGTFFPETCASIEYCDEERVVVEQECEITFWRIRLHFITYITFEKSERRITYRTEFTPSGRHYRLRVAFPTTIEQGRRFYEIPFGIQERGAGEHVAQNWVDYSEPDCGVALLNRGIPSNNIDDGTVLLTLFRAVDMEYKSPSDMTHNIGTPHVFEYAVVPHGDISPEILVAEGLRFANPPIPLRTDIKRLQDPDGAPTMCPIVQSDRENIIISGVRWSEGMIFVRLYESVGANGTTCRLRVRERVTAYAKSDGLERAIEKFMDCESAGINRHGGGGESPPHSKE